MVIELKGIRYTFKTKCFRNVKCFPAEDLDILKKTYTTQFEKEALFGKLR